MQTLVQDHILSLSQLSNIIQNVIASSFNGKKFWVKAEIHKLNIYKYSGHAYPELVEKKDDSVVCQMKGVIWRDTLLKINQKFMDVLNEPLKDNIIVLMLISVRYSANYGISLYIHDIDPSYTLGELEREKRQTIEKLIKENIFEKNKQLELPIVLQHLAVISVETSKGYNDMITTFQKYENKFKIYHDLYPSLLQGEEAASQIIQHLNAIREKTNLYDAVLIIRGGGGEIGLSCYNDYELARTIATFPIPVITGIGHSTNFTVAEMVAHTNGITPTDTAMIIINRCESFLQKIQQYQQRLHQLTTSILQQQHQYIQNVANNIALQLKELIYQQNIALNDYQKTLINTTQTFIFKHQHKILSIANKIKHATQFKMNDQEKFLQKIHHTLQYATQKNISRHHQKIQRLREILMKYPQQIIASHIYKLQSIEKQIHLLHPNNILKRGYSIIFKDQKIVTSAHQLTENDTLVLQFYDSTIQGNIINIKSNNLSKTSDHG